MATITIPQKLTKEKDLIVIPRSEYENLLKYAVVGKQHENLWSVVSKDKFLKSYSESDTIYDQI